MVAEQALGAPQVLVKSRFGPKVQMSEATAPGWAGATAQRGGHLPFTRPRTLYTPPPRPARQK